MLCVFASLACCVVCVMRDICIVCIVRIMCVVCVVCDACYE